MDTEALKYVLIALATAAGSAVNAIAGGGTLITFPVLLSLGIPSIVANATSTVALVPGAMGAFVGYRDALTGARSWATKFAVPSLLGGLVGALLLLVTPQARFDAAVPWLVIGATLLFVAQRPLMRLRRVPVGDQREPTESSPPWSILVFQFGVAIYGGYFGAGIGILMLAALGMMGFSSIHRMNGLKSFGGMCTNVVAAITFAVSGIVDWRLAATMAVGAIFGGYGGSRLAQRVPQEMVRKAIIVIGFASGVWLLIQRSG